MAVLRVPQEDTHEPCEGYVKHVLQQFRPHYITDEEYKVYLPDMAFVLCTNSRSHEADLGRQFVVTVLRTNARDVFRAQAQAAAVYELHNLLTASWGAIIDKLGKQIDDWVKQRRLTADKEERLRSSVVRVIIRVACMFVKKQITDSSQAFEVAVTKAVAAPAAAEVAVRAKEEAAARAKKEAADKAAADAAAMFRRRVPRTPEAGEY